MTQNSTKPYLIKSILIEVLIVDQSPIDIRHIHISSYFSLKVFHKLHCRRSEVEVPQVEPDTDIITISTFTGRLLEGRMALKKCLILIPLILFLSHQYIYGTIYIQHFNSIGKDSLDIRNSTYEYEHAPMKSESTPPINSQDTEDKDEVVEQDTKEDVNAEITQKTNIDATADTTTTESTSDETQSADTDNSEKESTIQVSETSDIPDTHDSHDTPHSSTTTHTNVPPVRKWAYAYLIGGCSSTIPKYRAYIYNALVVAKRMRDFGSKADVVVMIQMWGQTDETALPDADVKMLEDAGVKVVYIPKLAPYMQDVFYTLMLEKFRILTLTEYSRVLYMDGDVIPTCNLDYLFDLSEPDPAEGKKALLKENMILGWRQEPASGGFFMFRPDMDDWAVMQQIIRDREEEVLRMEYPWWNATIGWGHQITEPGMCYIKYLCSLLIGNGLISVDSANEILHNLL